VIYILILLLNNNIDQIFEAFLSTELFVCVGLALLVTEANLLVMKQFSNIRARYNLTNAGILTTALSISITSAIVCISLCAYFKLHLGFSPTTSDVLPFLALYLGLSISYCTIYLSNHIIEQGVTAQLLSEERLKEEARESFIKLTRGIKPDLLFESLEGLITYIYDDKDAADDMIDDLSIVYRYSLSNHHKEAIPIKEELYALEAFIRLVNKLPYREAILYHDINTASHIIPSSLINIIEQIIRTTIVQKDKGLELSLTVDKKDLVLIYTPHDRLTQSVTSPSLDEMNKSYLMYTEKGIRLQNDEKLRSIRIPTLSIQNDH